MATYREHQQLICLIHELVNQLDTQSQFLLELAREHTIPESLPNESSLRSGWQDLGFAFSLLTHHAQALQTEFDRLNIVPPEPCTV